MQPEHGGRIELSLESMCELEVVYAAELSTPQIGASGRARVALGDGRVSFELAPEPPAWLLDVARGVLRSLWRARAEAGWPRRITRWRTGPEGEA